MLYTFPDDVFTQVFLALLHQEAEPQSVAQVHRTHREAEVILHGKVGAGLRFGVGKNPGRGV